MQAFLAPYSSVASILSLSLPMKKDSRRTATLFGVLGISIIFSWVPCHPSRAALLLNTNRYQRAHTAHVRRKVFMVSLSLSALVVLR